MNSKDQGGIDAALAVLFLAFAVIMLVLVIGGLASVLGRVVGLW